MKLTAKAGYTNWILLPKANRPGACTHVPGQSRHLTVNPAPVNSTPISVRYDALQGATGLEHVESLPNLKAVDAVQCEALGSPPAALSVGAPPSLPVYIRRNSLMALQGNLSNVTITSRFISPLKRLIYGNFPSQYHEILGTEPYTMLVSSTTPSWIPQFLRKTTSKSFTNLALDGTTDWAVLSRTALQMYAGPSIEVSMRPLPTRISRQLVKNLKLPSRESVGLWSWLHSGYTFVHGRGTVGLVGNGSIYQATVSDGDQVAINKNHLLGVSVNGPHDLQNCVVQATSPVHIQNVSFSPPPQVDHIKTFRDVLAQLKYYYWKTFMFFRDLRSFWRASVGKVKPGNTDFVKIVGPRSVLIQSAASSESFERKFRLPSVTPSATVAPASHEAPAKVPADYLNIVTIDPDRGPIIESTDDFKDALKHKK